MNAFVVATSKVTAAVAVALLAACAIEKTGMPGSGANVADVRDRYVAGGYACTPSRRDQILCERPICLGCTRNTPRVLITYDLDSFKVIKIMKIE